MISVYYTPLGTPVSDFEAESTVDNIIEIYKNKSSHKDENNEKTYSGVNAFIFSMELVANIM